MIDAHIHLDGSDLHPATLEEGDRLGVRLFVGSSICNYEHYPTWEQVRLANDDMVAVTRRYPDRVAGYCYVNPRHGEKAMGRDAVQRSVGLSLHRAGHCLSRAHSCSFLAQSGRTASVRIDGRSCGGSRAPLSGGPYHHGPHGRTGGKRDECYSSIP